MGEFHSSVEVNQTYCSQLEVAASNANHYNMLRDAQSVYTAKVVAMFLFRRGCLPLPNPSVFPSTVRAACNNLEFWKPLLQSPGFGSMAAKSVCLIRSDSVLYADTRCAKRLRFP